MQTLQSGEQFSICHRLPGARERLVEMVTRVDQLGQDHVGGSVENPVISSWFRPRAHDLRNAPVSMSTTRPRLASEFLREDVWIPAGSLTQSKLPFGWGFAPGVGRSIVMAHLSGQLPSPVMSSTGHRAGSVFLTAVQGAAGAADTTSHGPVFAEPPAGCLFIFRK